MKPPETSSQSDRESPEQGNSLASLHKMSRTAGLSTQDYVAINPTSVVAFLLGLASALAVMASVLLLIPAVAVIVAIVSIVQIRRSGGTEAGKGLAIGGLVLAVACVALVGGRAVLHSRQIRVEQEQIVQLIESLGKNLATGNYDAAWEQFTPRVHETAKAKDFAETWTRIQLSPYYGKIKSARWNGLLDVTIDSEGEPMAQGYVIFDLGNGMMDRRGTHFRKIEGRWLVDDMQINFAPQAPQAPALPMFN